MIAQFRHIILPIFNLRNPILPIGSLVEHWRRCYSYVPPEDTGGVIGLKRLQKRRKRIIKLKVRLEVVVTRVDTFLIHRSTRKSDQGNSDI